MGTASQKENIIKYYNREAELRDSKSVKDDWKIVVREKFRRLIAQENKKTLLELGAGTGYDSLFFIENGLDVVAVDISPEMIKKCKEKSIEAYELDFGDLSSLDRKFDCVYTMNALLHVPKADLGMVLDGIDSTLNPNGLFYVGIYGGQDVEKDVILNSVWGLPIGSASDAPRFYAFHSAGYLKDVLAKHFEILEYEQIGVDKGEISIFHSVTLRKIDFPCDTDRIMI